MNEAKQIWNKKVFLGGTCNESKWRDELIKKLKIDYFNPVVPDWTEECYQEELRQRESCDFCLYVITPKMTGSYSIAEVVDDSNKRPEKTVFCFVSTDEDKEFDKAQNKSLDKVGVMVASNGGTYLKSLDEVANFLNMEYYIENNEK
ncbi:MAG: nucleoside 2-deoxyribosyltransferase domain-containing protein [Clostridia bacterium]|nr:nucleoside 2-deoxyribosyltransferase domain-containing protein [Clostridia bacterium]